MVYINIKIEQLYHLTYLYDPIIHQHTLLTANSAVLIIPITSTWGHAPHNPSKTWPANNQLSSVNDDKNCLLSISVISICDVIVLWCHNTIMYHYIHLLEIIPQKKIGCVVHIQAAVVLTARHREEVIPWRFLKIRTVSSAFAIKAAAQCTFFS